MVIDKKKEASGLGLLFIGLILWNLFFSFFVAAVEQAIELPWWGIHILLEAGNVLLAFLYLERCGTDIFETLQIKKIRLRTLVRVAVLGLVIEQIGIFFNLLSQLIVPNMVTSMAGEMFQNGSFTAFVIVAVMAPAYEELTFRGVIFNRYKKITSVWKAVLLSGLLFGLFHLNLNQFGYAMVHGIYFALCNEACGSMLPSFIMHMMINGSSVLMMSTLMNFEKTVGQKAFENIAKAIELDKAVNTMAIRSMLGPYAIRALVAFLISMPLLISIAKSEGNEDAFLSVFVKDEESADGDKEEKGSALSVPTVIAIILAVGIMVYTAVVLCDMR